ncbi:hypothetical protein VNI00_000488 [Paramarasmius palmivorus]|uniref:Protein-S-isoprenylcysteine O-methyltransferase n=1 Tax=Paramarasmius palmivorus TaxID=297713 RepID=A0AAW0E5K9_9AGAR
MTSLTNLTFKSSLILITALSLSIALTPPNGPPKSLPPRPPLTRKTIFTTQMREWFLTLYAINLLPIMLKLYWLASFNEVVHIFLTNSDHLDPLLIIGTIIAVSGTTFRYLSFRYLGEAFTFEFVPVGQRAKDPKASAKLITHGTYAIIRHPAYTGRLIAHFGYITVPNMDSESSELAGGEGVGVYLDVHLHWIDVFGIYKDER